MSCVVLCNLQVCASVGCVVHCVLSVVLCVDVRVYLLVIQVSTTKSKLIFKLNMF